MQPVDVKHEMVSVTEAQKILNVEKKVIYKIIKSGKLTTRKIGPKVKINKRSLRAYVECHSNLLKDVESKQTFDDVTPAELKMISDWT